MKVDKTWAKVYAQPKGELGYVEKDGFLYINIGAAATGIGPWRLVIPSLMKNTEGMLLTESLIKNAYESIGHGHNKITYAQLTDKYIWKNMYSDTQEYCAGCLACQAAKSSTRHKYGLLTLLDVPTRPWSKVSMDFLYVKEVWIPISVLYPHLLKIPGLSGKMVKMSKLLVIVNLLTSFSFLIPVPSDITTQNVINI